MSGVVATPRQGLDYLANYLARRPEGDRNQTLFWATCKALEEGHDPEEVAARMYDAAMTSGLEHRESVATIRSAVNRVEDKNFTSFWNGPTGEMIRWIQDRSAGPWPNMHSSDSRASPSSRSSSRFDI